MGNLKLYGTSVTSLSDFVEQFCIENGNTNENHITRTIFRAKMVWRDLLKNTIWSIKNVVLNVDKASGTIQLPQDLVRLFSISVVDSCGKLQTLGYNKEYNTMQISCTPKCSCECGGAGTLCEAVESLAVRYETVILFNAEHTKTIWNKWVNGAILEYSKTPYLSADGESVEYLEESRIICELETTTEGCIKATDKNRDLLAASCGCYIPSCAVNMFDCCAPEFKNDYGYYNWDAIAKDIIHLRYTHADKVILSYESDGDCSGKEIMIPNYALDAMMLGILYRQAVIGNGASETEKEQSERRYERAKEKIFKLLNPITPDALKKIQSAPPPKW